MGTSEPILPKLKQGGYITPALRPSSVACFTFYSLIVLGKMHFSSTAE